MQDRLVAFTLSFGRNLHALLATYRVPRLLGGLDLLILDDWGLVSLTASEARDLREVVDDRSMTRSTLVVHNAYRLALKGESMRKVIPDSRTNEQEAPG